MLLSHVFAALVDLGFTVWYDENDMGYDLQASMQDGIRKCKVFLCCLNSTYESRDNCMFELRETRRLHPDKPVVTLLLQNPFGDPSKDPGAWDAKQETRDLLNFKGAMFCDLSKSVAVNERFKPSHADGPTPELLKELAVALAPLVKILKSVNCTPTLQPLQSK